MSVKRICVIITKGKPFEKIVGGEEGRNKMDRYSKFILTIIAILLMAHLVKPLFMPERAEAERKVIDVNIAEVTYSGSFPVAIVTY